MLQNQQVIIYPKKDTWWCYCQLVILEAELITCRKIHQQRDSWRGNKCLKGFMYFISQEDINSVSQNLLRFTITMKTTPVCWLQDIELAQVRCKCCLLSFVYISIAKKAYTPNGQKINIARWSMKEELERAPNGPEQLQSLMLSSSSTLGIYCKWSIMN